MCQAQLVLCQIPQCRAIANKLPKAQPCLCLERDWVAQLKVAQLGQDLCSSREAVFSASGYEYSTWLASQSKDIRDLVLALGKANMLRQTYRNYFMEYSILGKKKNKPQSKTFKCHWVMQQNTHFEDIIDRQHIKISWLPGQFNSRITPRKLIFFIITLLFKLSSFVMEFFAYDNCSFK